VEQRSGFLVILLTDIDRYLISSSQPIKLWQLPLS